MSSTRTTARDQLASALEPVLAQLAAPPIWDDADELIEAALPALQAICATPATFRCALEGVEDGSLPLIASDRGVHWVHLADDAELGVSVDLRFSPVGGVSAPHAHPHARAMQLLHGGYKQTLVGVGGGVASPPDEIPLYIRHEPTGQLFALTAEQRHASSSTVGALLLALQPYEAHVAAGDCRPGNRLRLARKLMRALASGRLLD